MAEVVNTGKTLKFENYNVSAGKGRIRVYRHL